MPFSKSQFKDLGDLSFSPFPTSLSNNILKNLAYTLGLAYTIFGCFFHLSQAWLKKLRTLGLTKFFAFDKAFVKSFKLCQSLAFLPCSEVAAAFDQIKELSGQIVYPSKNILNEIIKEV